MPTLGNTLTLCNGGNYPETGDFIRPSAAKMENPGFTLILVSICSLARCSIRHLVTVKSRPSLLGKHPHLDSGDALQLLTASFKVMNDVLQMVREESGKGHRPSSLHQRGTAGSTAF